MRRSGKRVTMVLAKAFCLALLAALAPGVALATGSGDITLPVTARGYHYNSGSGTDLHFLDGVITNDSSVTVCVDKVLIGWNESVTATSSLWAGGDTLAPGEWTTFHQEWPDGIDGTWTIGSSTAVAHPSDASHAIGVSVGAIGPVNVEGGMRWYSARITNTSALTVSSIKVVGREVDGGSTFIDSLFSWDLPDSLAPGQQADIIVRGKDTSASPSATPQIARITALEKPTITLTYDTLRPVYGSPITFRINLARSDGSPATGYRTLKIYHSFDGDHWEGDYFHQDTTTGSVTTSITPDRPTYYRAVYWGGDDLGQVMSEWVLATPQLANGAPTAPKSIRLSRAFLVAGRLTRGPGNSATKVTIFAEKKVGRRWIRKLKTTTSVDAGGAYKKSLKLKSRGTWRIRAYRPGVGYSKYRTVRVR